jgi:hypothetical protein
MELIRPHLPFINITYCHIGDGIILPSIRLVRSTADYKVHNRCNCPDAFAEHRIKFRSCCDKILSLNSIKESWKNGSPCNGCMCSCKYTPKIPGMLFCVSNI